MAGKTLYDKLWDSHVVREESDGTCLLYIDRHLMHEVTSPQAFEGLRLAGRRAWRASSVVANPDHNTPTEGQSLGMAGVKDAEAREQLETLARNVAENGIQFFPMGDIRNCIVALADAEPAMGRLLQYRFPGPEPTPAVGADPGLPPVRGAEGN